MHDQVREELVGKYGLPPYEKETVFHFQFDGCLAVNRDVESS